MATDALADLVSTGALSGNRQSYVSRNVRLVFLIAHRCDLQRSPGHITQTPVTSELLHCELVRENGIKQVNELPTSGIQFFQVRGAKCWQLRPRLSHSTHHRPTTAPLLAAQSIIASGSVGSIGVLLGAGGLREDGGVLEPRHGHLFWVESVHVAVESERAVVGGWGESGETNSGGI